MNGETKHVVILGGPEERTELLAIVLNDGEAIPLFDSTEEANEFLTATGDFARDWYAVEVSADELKTLLESQSEEVRHVAVSPPPEDWGGGMEIQVLDIETFILLLERQSETFDEPEEKPRRGFFRRLFGR